MADEVKAPHELVAGCLPSAAGVGVAPALVLVALDCVRLHAGADVRDRLIRVAAVGRGEDLVLALRRVARLGEGDALDTKGGGVGGGQLVDLRLQRDREGVLGDRRFVCPVGGWPVVEVDGAPEGGRGCPRDADRFRSDAVDLGGFQQVRAREAPRAIDEHADAEALGLARRHAFEPARLDGDRLFGAAHDPDVGVGGAALGGRVQRAVSHLTHGSRQTNRTWSADGGAATADSRSAFSR